MKLPASIFIVIVGVWIIGCDVNDKTAISATQPAAEQSQITPTATMPPATAPFAGETIVKTEEEWKQVLTPEQFHVLRERGTELAFVNEYNANKEPGIYVCAACGLELFSSEHKYDSGTGWPSFWQPSNPGHIGTATDHELGHPRTEVHCARCGGHLGHVFEDGPQPTGLRYCMNSATMKFIRKGER